MNYIDLDYWDELLDFIIGMNYYWDELLDSDYWDELLDDLHLFQIIIEIGYETTSWFKVLRWTNWVRFMRWTTNSRLMRWTTRFRFISIMFNNLISILRWIHVVHLNIEMNSLFSLLRWTNHIIEWITWFRLSRWTHYLDNEMKLVSH